MAAIALVQMSCEGAKAPDARLPEPAAKMTLSNPVAAIAQVRAPRGYPETERDCPACFLRWRDLSGANLAGADLEGADLALSNLAGADLSGANLTAADLSGADLTGAVLDRANLYRAKIPDVELAGADLSGARWVDGEPCANGSAGACVPAAESQIGPLLTAASLLPGEEYKSFAVTGEGGAAVRGRISKWYGGARAAVSITYDSAYGTWSVHYVTANMVVSRGLHMDHEIVTAFYLQPRWYHLVHRLQVDLEPRGIHLFGHGHEHVNHDSLTYEEALASMAQCKAQMEAWGFRARAYSYPYSHGYEEETQRACRDAGFICGRGSTLDLDQVFMCADDEVAPENWYYLPAVSMARDFDGYINDHEELEPLLSEAEERGAWLVLMYHAIGQPLGWGYYPIEEFGKDLDRIAEGDIWSANMDVAAAYVQERNATAVSLVAASPCGDVVLALDDGLDEGVYDEPLTLILELNEAMVGGTLVVEGRQGEGRYVAVGSEPIRMDAVPDGRPLGLRLYPASRPPPRRD